MPASRVASSLAASRIFLAPAWMPSMIGLSVAPACPPAFCSGSSNGLACCCVISVSCCTNRFNSGELTAPSVALAASWPFWPANFSACRPYA